MRFFIMLNRKINILLIGNTTEKCHFACHAPAEINGIRFSVDAWFEEERSHEAEFLAYIKSKIESTKDEEFAVIYVEGAKAKHMEMVEGSKPNHWVTNNYDGGDSKAFVTNCLLDVASQSKRSFTTVFYGTAPATLKETSLEKIPSALFSTINHYLFYKPRTIAPSYKPSHTTVFQGNNSKHLKDTHLDNIPADLHPVINHYSLYQPRPKMELPTEEPKVERKNRQETCIIS